MQGFECIINENEKMSEEKQAAITIVIPVYNIPMAYISSCLNSVLGQDLDNIEIICIDDASTDGTLEILERHMENDSRLKVLKNHSNRGFLFSRNKGIDAANGQYILFLDADDTLNPNSLKKAYNHATSYDLDLLFYDLHIEQNELKNSVYDSGDMIHRGIYPSVCNGVEMFGLFAKNGCNYGASTVCLYKRSFLINNSIRFDEDIEALDEFFYCKVMLKANRVGCINLVVYNYFLRSDSMEHSIDRTEKRYLGALKNCVKTVDFFEEHKELLGNIEDAVNQYKNWTFATVLMAASSIPNLADLSVKDMQDKRVKLLHDVICYIENSRRNEIDISTLNRVKESGKKIIIYGAGNDASKVISLLHEMGIDEFEIAISSKNDNLFFMGKKVIPIDEFKDVKDDIIILVASRKYKSDMVNYLSVLGFNDYITI